MPLNKSMIIKCDLHAGHSSRAFKSKLADDIISQAIKFINSTVQEEKLNLSLISMEYDPTHESRWIHFFLRESVRNSIDSCFRKPSECLENIQIKITLKTKPDGHLYLKIKDNGVGFMAVERSVPFTCAPTPSKKDKAVDLGGSGFGLSICSAKLAHLIFKNRKAEGASVQCSLGNETDLRSYKK